MTSFRLKHFLERNDGGCWGDDPTGIDDTVVLRSTEQSSDGEWRITDPAVRHISASERKSKTIELDDIIITKSSGSTDHIGKASIADQTVAELEAVYSNFMQRIRINSRASPKYVWHLLNSFFARYHYNIYANSTSGLGNLNSRIVGNLLFPIPDLLTQQAIADFLDCETARIDSLIKKKQRLEELLGEKRNVLITTAVTGNNLNTPEKSGGRNRRFVEGGEVIDTFLEQFASKYRWMIAPAKRRFQYRKDINKGMRETHRMALTMRGVIDRSLDDLEGLQASDYSTYQIFEQGDIAFKLIDLENIKTSRVGLVPRRGIMSSAYIRLMPTSPDADSRFYSWFFFAVYLNNIFNGMGGGVRQNLTPTDLLEFPIPIPDLPTQRAIADFLDRETTRIDKIIERTRISIDRLKEYRSALITAAVTGQINVSTYARSRTTDRQLDAIQSEIQA